MRNLKRNDWVTILFFGACGLFTAYCVYFLMNLPSIPQIGDSAAAIPGPQQADSSSGYVLVKGEASAMGNLKLRYVGLDEDIILIDVTIVDLDPEYAYRHRIARHKATDGFQVAGQTFKLLSVNGSVLKLRLS